MKKVYDKGISRSQNISIFLINKFLNNPSDQSAYLDLLCNFENVSMFEIEDDDLLDYVKSNVSDSFKRIINVGTTGVNVVSGRNFDNNDKYFKFYRLFVKFVAVDGLKFDPNYLYSKDELNYFIDNNMIYPLSYSSKNLDHVPVQYEELDDVNKVLNVPYCCPFSYVHGENVCNFDDGVKEYFINKLNGEYGIEWIFNKIRKEVEDIFYENYLDEIYFYEKVRECNAHIKRCYDIKDMFNNVIDSYGLSNIKKLEFVTLDNLYDYLVSNGKDIDNDYIVRLICRLNQEEFNRCVSAVVGNGDSKLCCDIITSIQYDFDCTDMVNAIINNNDVESCYRLLSDYCFNFSKSYLLKMAKIVALSGNEEYIIHIVDMGIISNNDVKKLVRR